MQGPTAKLAIPGITREGRCPDGVNCGIWGNNLLTQWQTLVLIPVGFGAADVHRCSGRESQNLHFRIGSVLFWLRYFASRGL